MTLWPTALRPRTTSSRHWQRWGSCKKNGKDFNLRIKMKKLPDWPKYHRFKARSTRYPDSLKRHFDLQLLFTGDSLSPKYNLEPDSLKLSIRYVIIYGWRYMAGIGTDTCNIKAAFTPQSKLIASFLWKSKPQPWSCKRTKKWPHLPCSWPWVFSASLGSASTNASTLVSIAFSVKHASHIHALQTLSQTSTTTRLSQLHFPPAW